MVGGVRQSYGSGGWDPGTYEVIRPVAMFLQQFVKPPDDYVSVVAFDMRPTPLTDFTNDPARISQVINLLLRNYPAFRETNLFDALKFVLDRRARRFSRARGFQRAKNLTSPDW